jgi:hypothetical protein
MIRDLQKEQNNVNKAPKMMYRLWLADLNDVDVDNFPKSVNATIQVNPLKAGKYFHFLDANPKNMKPNAAPGESPHGGVLTLTPVIEGISKATLAWIYENVGKEVIVIWERCSDRQRFIGGSPCSDGLTIKYTTIGEQDGGVLGINLSFEGAECPEPFLFYDGEIPTLPATPVTIAGGTFALPAASQLILRDNTSATNLTDITGVTDADVGRVIELQGAGVNFPTQIASSAKFILQNGMPFSAALGNSIFFQITKTGANAYAFFEVDRR